MMRLEKKKTLFVLGDIRGRAITASRMVNQRDVTLTIIYLPGPFFLMV